MPNPDFALTSSARPALPLYLLAAADLSGWLKKQTSLLQRWVGETGYKAGAGEVLLLPDAMGALAGVLVGGQADDMWALGALPYTLPPATYALKNVAVGAQEKLALGWALGAYRFDKYVGKKGRTPARLALSALLEKKVSALADATYLVRDLINEPANHLGPDELAEAAHKLARAHKAQLKIIRGEALLKANYPAIYAVGKGSERPPLLIDLRWGKASAPKLTLVGKGVVFDTGGYDIKPSSGMLTMKKDMGGAAHVLGLAQLIMTHKLNVRLRVLIPAVENSISGRAMRPLDIYKTRSGQSVEIGNTDAEGRVILCDCLHEAAQEKPEWIIDFATLTGARSVALGTEVPALFCNNDKLTQALLKAGAREHDPLWQLPLHQPYWKSMKSKIADMNNAGSSGYGGAITAALFLQQFVHAAQSWAHIDLMAWNTGSQPGRPEGGEAMGLRATYAAIESRFSKSRA